MTNYRADFAAATARAEGELMTNAWDRALLPVTGNINVVATYMDGELCWWVHGAPLEGHAKVGGTSSEGLIYAGLRYAQQAARNQVDRYLGKV